ncbi:MAG: hypothetical protein CM1200mP30_06520 [Pseudomonadota bacterium]|nr:MAG: hypothetical protein CM1200mP30_06520 [Pseudomonadota bacterium]
MECESRTTLLLLPHTFSSLYCDRFLPDKAIDLMDEAPPACGLKLTQCLRNGRDFQENSAASDEKGALKKESDPASKERLEKLLRNLLNYSTFRQFDPSVGKRKVSPSEYERIKTGNRGSAFAN